MAGVRQKPVPSGKYQGFYVDATGKPKFFTGTRNRAETKRMAEKLEDEHRQVRLGYRPAPTSADKHRKRPCSEVMDEYRAWGEAQGGRGGRPWSDKHAANRRTQLGWWRERLGLETLVDLDGILPRVEEVVRERLRAGKKGKTVAGEVEGLRSFCTWCEKRGFLDRNPLKALAPLDTTPQTVRRAMTLDEIRRLLEIAPPERRLLYETAFCSGLRAGELRHLAVDHLDEKRGGLHLEAAWTKNRKPGFQPLPRVLVERLAAFAESGEARHLYEKTSVWRLGDAPENPLLYVPSQTDRTINADLKAAGIPKWTPAGKLDFHAARTAYVTMLLEAETTVKEAQELARHSTPHLTMNVYGRVRGERLTAAVERVGAMVLSEEKRAKYVYKDAVGAERENATLVETEGCAPQNLVAGVGFEPTTFGL